MFNYYQCELGAIYAVSDVGVVKIMRLHNKGSHCIEMSNLNGQPFDPPPGCKDISEYDFMEKMYDITSVNADLIGSIMSKIENFADTHDDESI